MTKKTITLFFCIFSFLVNGYAQIDTVQPKFIGKEYDFRIDRDKIINLYSDSLNSLSSADNIPAFVFNECIEYDIKLRKDYHAETSVRWEILKKVSSKKALQIIMQSQDPRLRRKCEMYKGEKKLNNTFSDKSFYDLLKKRCGALK